MKKRNTNQTQDKPVGVQIVGSNEKGTREKKLIAGAASVFQEVQIVTKGREWQRNGMAVRSPPFLRSLQSVRL